MLDEYWHSDTKGLSEEAPVAAINVSQKDYRAGGAANVALNIKKLVPNYNNINKDNVNIGLLAPLGIDSAGAKIKIDIR